jgi:hypothetical protein
MISRLPESDRTADENGVYRYRSISYKLVVEQVKPLSSGLLNGEAGVNPALSRNGDEVS